MKYLRRISLNLLTIRHKNEFLSLKECANKYVDDSKFSFKIKESDLDWLKPNDSLDLKEIKITDIFRAHQNKLDEEKEEFSSTIETVPYNEVIENESQQNSTFYMISSVKVKWISNQIAYMHIFTDISSVKKYEKERATNKWLHIMFSSVSHEFRTPLNAISNSVTLLSMNMVELI